MKPKALEERFWEKVHVCPEGCWEWTASLTGRGYGKMGHSGKMILSHRLSWELNYGPIPNGFSVCHKCDNTKCVRPDHLFLGTLSDNIQDMIRKGRANPPRGVRCAWAKLTESDVREIRKLKGLTTQRKLADRFGVNPQQISKIQSGQQWGHIR